MKPEPVKPEPGGTPEHENAQAVSFDPELFETTEESPEETPEEDAEQLASIEGELQALGTEATKSQPEQTTDPGTEVKAGNHGQPAKGAQPDTGLTDAGLKRPRRSAEDMEKMRASRERARNQALERGPAAPGASRGGPSTAWGSRAAAQSGPNPFRDPRLAAAETAAGPPLWLGTRWRDIAVAQQREAWIGLRRWVDWLINEYRLPEQVVPACWYLHPNLVEELYAAMCMEFKAWEEAAPSLTPMMMWHPNLQAMITRLREQVADLGTCVRGEHQAVEHLARDYDEDQWRRIAYGRRENTTVQRPKADEEGYLLRARLIGPDGKELAVSDSVVGIAAIKGAEPATVQLRRDRTTAAKDSVIHLEAEAAAEAEKVIWEKAATWTADETTGEIVAADWKPQQQEDQTSQDKGSDPDQASPASPSTKQTHFSGDQEIPKESRL